MYAHIVCLFPVPLSFLLTDFVYPSFLPSFALLHHSQTTGAKVTGLWQHWWQCHSASRLSQYWHNGMWILPTNFCLSTVGACQPLSVRAKNLPTNDNLVPHKQVPAKSQDAGFFPLTEIKMCFREIFRGNVLLCRIPTSCWKTKFSFQAATVSGSNDYWLIFSSSSSLSICRHKKYCRLFT